MVRLLPSIQRDRARKALRKRLAMADDAAFMRMIWAVDRLQDGDPELAARHLTYPREAVGGDITSTYRVHRWVMETLVNELLVTPKQGILLHRPTRMLNCEHFDALATVVNALNELENGEAGVWLLENNILLEMHRIAQRQFHWQRGFANIPQFYRTAFLYGVDDADALFRRRHGLSVAEFAQVGFALFILFTKQPFVSATVDLSSTGITAEVRDAALKLVALPHAEARAQAQKLRSGPGQVAYKPSLFRERPCILFDRDRHIASPIPELVVQRVTSGVFYDLLGDGSVRNSVAGRFETYCRDLVVGMLPGVQVTREVSYNGDRNRTPDLLLGRAGALFAVVECKATRMRFEAKFGDRPLEEAETGYEEMRKAVVQVWRFFSHQRRGLVDVGSAVPPEAVGLVLTLDEWMTMSGPMRTEIVERARSFARDREPDILEEDMRPVVFCPIDDLEFTLSRASLDEFVEALRLAVTPKYTGYHLSSVLRETQSERGQPKPYPFKDRLGEVLPWWGDLRARAEAA